jgi:hypothetical protein
MAACDWPDRSLLRVTASRAEKGARARQQNRGLEGDVVGPVGTRRAKVPFLAIQLAACRAELSAPRIAALLFLLQCLP